MLFCVKLFSFHERTFLICIPKLQKATIKNSDESYNFKIKERIFSHPIPSSRCVTVSHLMKLNGAMYLYCSFVCFLVFSWRSGVITVFVHRGFRLNFFFTIKKSINLILWILMRTFFLDTLYNDTNHNSRTITILWGVINCK